MDYFIILCVLSNKLNTLEDTSSKILPVGNGNTSFVRDHIITLFKPEIVCFEVEIKIKIEKLFQNSVRSQVRATLGLGRK